MSLRSAIAAGKRNEKRQQKAQSAKPAKPVISFVALQEPDVRREAEEADALWEDIHQ